MDLGQCFHHETRVEMINKVAHTIDSIKPGAVRILILQNEIQISFCDSPVVFVGKNFRGAGQQKGAVSGGINDSSLIRRSVGTTARRFRRPEILDISCGVARNRFKNQFPLVSLGLDLAHCEGMLVHIRRRCDQRRLPLDRAPAPDPVEWITPAIFFELGGSAIF